MKLKLYEIVNTTNIFEEMCKIKTPSRVTYWLMRNIKLIRDDYAFYEKDNIRIINEYLEKNEDGTFVIKDDEGNVIKDENGNPMLNYKDVNKKGEYIDELEKLNNLDIEISPYILDYSKVVEESPSFSIEPMYLVPLMDKFIKVD